MPTPAQPRLRLGVVEPKDAVAAFEARKLLLPSFRWQDVWQEEHQRGFAVAGVMRLDVLQIFQQALDDKFATGGSLDDFKKSVKPLLAKKGFWGDVGVTNPATGENRITRFDDARLKLIFDVNVRQSAAAGKWQRYQKTKAVNPFIRYLTMEDGRVRPAHQAWDNLVLPIDDAFWQGHWPPNGWRCRCRVVQMNQRDIDEATAAGEKLQRTAPPESPLPYINPHTGDVKAVPAGVDPGFGYNPGADNSGRDEALAETLLQKAIASPAYAAAAVAAQAATDMPALLARHSAAFARWTDQVLQRQQPDGTTFTLGTFRPEIVRALAAAGIEPDSAMLAVRDRDVLHALREPDEGETAPQSAPGSRKRREDQREAIPLELYAQLPSLLARPSAVLRVLDATDRDAIAYVIDVADSAGRALKLFVWINQKVQTIVDGQRVKNRLNIVRTAALQLPRVLQDPNAFSVLWGTWP